MNFVKRTQAPTLSPVTLDQAKAHCKVTGTDEDDIVQIYLDAAVNACENKLQTAIMDSGFTLYARGFNSHLSLQKNYVSAISSVMYYDATGASTLVSSANYTLQDFKIPNVLYFNETYSFPSTDDREFPVEVTFRAGFTSASSVFPVIRSAVFLEVGDRYENRQNEVIGERIAVVMFNATAEKLLAEEAMWI